MREEERLTDEERDLLRAYRKQQKPANDNDGDAGSSKARRAVDFIEDYIKDERAQLEIDEEYIGMAATPKERIARQAETVGKSLARAFTGERSLLDLLDDD